MGIACGQPLKFINLVALGISFSSGVNVVKVGEQLDLRLQELENIKPAGIEIHTLYNQAKEIDESVNGFIISLAQAVGIVIIVLLFTMGLCSGIIIGKRGRSKLQAAVDIGQHTRWPLLGATVIAITAFAAITIMFGLGFATILTLVVVPVLYALLHKIQAPLPESPALSTVQASA